jgi:predicted nucleic acid-binding protein
VSTWWFPDNTVLCNFAAVDRLPLLKEVLDGKGRWTEAVAHEALLSARYLPLLRTLPLDGWLGDPIEIDDEAERQAVERVRRSVFHGDRAVPTQHLGEAQTCVLITSRREFRASAWITDDRSAGTFSRRKGIRTLETMDLMALAAKTGLVKPAEGHRLLHAMTAAGRHLHHISSRPDDLLH